MDIKVKKCGGCPFLSLVEIFGEGYNYCKVYKDGDNRILRVDDIDADNYNEIIHPIWCPLKEESIEVYLDK